MLRQSILKRLNILKQFSTVHLSCWTTLAQQFNSKPANKFNLIRKDFVRVI